MLAAEGIVPGALRLKVQRLATAFFFNFFFFFSKTGRTAFLYPIFFSAGIELHNRAM